MARTIWAVWYGGSSYVSSGDEGKELFPSIRAAVEAFDSRDKYGYGWKQTFVYADRTESFFTPTVDETAEMHLYFGGPDQEYPDRIIRFGPRGGIVVESC